MVGVTGIEGLRGVCASNDEVNSPMHTNNGTAIRIRECELLVVNCTYDIFAELDSGCLST